MQLKLLKKNLAVSLTAALLLSMAACATNNSETPAGSQTPNQTEGTVLSPEKDSEGTTLEVVDPASEAPASASETMTEPTAEAEVSGSATMEETETVPETETIPETEPETTEEDVEKAVLAALADAFPGLSVEGLIRNDANDLEWKGMHYHVLSELSVDESAYGSPFAARLAKAAENNAFQEDGYLVFLEGELYPSYFVEREGYQILPVCTGRKEGVYQVFPLRSGENHLEYYTLMSNMADAYSLYAEELYNAQYYLTGTITETAEDGTYMMVDGSAVRFEKDGTETTLSGTFRVATVPGGFYSADGKSVTLLTVFHEAEEAPAFPMVEDTKTADMDAPIAEETEAVEAESSMADETEAVEAESPMTDETNAPETDAPMTNETNAPEAESPMADETNAPEAEENVIRVAVVEASRLGQLKMGVYDQILPEIRNCEKILSNRMIIAGTVYTANLEGTQIEYRLPNNWVLNDTVLVREGQSLRFVHKASDMAECGGNLFSLMFFEDNSYMELPSMEVVTQKDGKTLVAIFPSDVQFDGQTADEYIALWDDIPAILDTVNIQ